MAYDALLLVSFGGPEGPDDVMPFLRNVVRGRDVPDERLAEVAEHYHHFGGVSPINAQCRDAARRAAARARRGRRGPAAVLGQPQLATRTSPTPSPRMRDDGVRRALAFVDQPVRLVLVVPAVPGRHRRRPGGGGAGRAGDRQDPALPRPSGLRRGRMPTRYGLRWLTCPMWSPGHAARVHRPLDTVHYGRAERAGRRALLGAAAGDRRAGGRRRRPGPALGSGRGSRAPGRRTCPGSSPTSTTTSSRWPRRASGASW